MKRALTKLVYVLFALSVAACGSNNSSNGTQLNQTATTPLDMRCLNGTTNCATSTYSNYGGWTTYSLPYNTPGYNYINYFTANGFCGCPGGYSPAYNSSMGLGCISSMALQPIYNYAVYMGFGYNGGFTTWMGGAATINIPQVSNIPGSAYQGACVHQITQSCLINQVNACGIGATCHQVITGSNLGVCINPNQQMAPPVYNNGFGFSGGFSGGFNGTW